METAEDPDGVGRRVTVSCATGQGEISDLQVSMVKSISEFWFSRRHTCQKRGRGNVFLVGSQGEEDRVGLLRWCSVPVCKDPGWSTMSLSKA